MALDLPISNVLTDTQGELTSKVSAIQSLLALPVFPYRNIPKKNQLSSFDYLMKILETMGIPPEPQFDKFIDIVLSEQNIFLENAVLNAFAYSLAKRNIILNQPPLATPLLSTEIAATQKVNFDLLKAQFGGLYLANNKKEITNSLIFSVFGGVNTPAGQILVPNLAERNRLIDGATCGDEMFSTSNPPISRNEDVEFNRIKLRQQLEKGQVEIMVNCQTSKIKLPSEPGFLLTGGGTQTLTGSSPLGTNAQTIQNVVNYTQGEIQKINNEKNAATGGKNFHRIMLEKLLSNITTLVSPHIVPVFNYITSQPGGIQLSLSDFIQPTCTVAENCGSSTSGVDHAFAFELSNEMYRELVSVILIFTIKEFKSFAVNYLKRLAIERAIRKAEKLKSQFKFGSITGAAGRLRKYKTALSSLSSIVPNIDNITNV